MSTPADAVPEETAREEPAPEQSAVTDSAESTPPDALRSAAAPPSPAAPPTPILPAQSREDTDAGGGDYAERDDNDRLLRDRPPHWDNG